MYYAHSTHIHTQSIRCTAFISQTNEICIYFFSSFFNVCIDRKRLLQLSLLDILCGFLSALALPLSASYIRPFRYDYMFIHFLQFVVVVAVVVPISLFILFNSFVLDLLFLFIFSSFMPRFLFIRVFAFVVAIAIYSFAMISMLHRSFMTETH